MSYNKGVHAALTTSHHRIFVQFHQGRTTTQCVWKDRLLKELVYTLRNSELRLDLFYSRMHKEVVKQAQYTKPAERMMVFRVSGVYKC